MGDNDMIRNLTPHPVIIVDGDNTVVHCFKPDGLARLKASVVACTPIGGVPTTITVFSKPEGLPEYTDGIWLIVSQLVKSACPDRQDLLVPADVVRDKDGNIIGCRALGR